MQQTTSPRPKIDTLILIGNGFDIWQRLKHQLQPIRRILPHPLGRDPKRLKNKKANAVR